MNLLGEDQEELCRLFAMSGADKFAEIGYSKAATGAPVIDDVLGFLDCTIEAEHEAGDHVIVVGRVHDLNVAHGSWWLANLQMVDALRFAGYDYDFASGRRELTTEAFRLLDVAMNQPVALVFGSYT